MLPKITKVFQKFSITLKIFNNFKNFQNFQKLSKFQRMSKMFPTIARGITHMKVVHVFKSFKCEKNWEDIKSIDEEYTN
jgi:hypothetical protein